jgi:hypothetical protein
LADAPPPDARECLVYSGGQPPDGARDISPVNYYGNFVVLYQFGGEPRLRYVPETIGTPVLAGPDGSLPLEWQLESDPTIVLGTVLGGVAPNSAYTLTIPAYENGPRSVSGLQVCEEIVVEFTTGAPEE